MTGREKIEAAFSSDGTPQTPAVICYEDLFLRDHWTQLTDLPWWSRHDPDIETQLAWRRDSFSRVRQDWFVLPACGSRSERQDLVLEVAGGTAALVSRHTGRRTFLQPPTVGGWRSNGKVQSVHPSKLPESFADVDASIGDSGDFDAGRFRAEGHADLADSLLEEFGTERTPLAHVSSPLWRCYSIWGFEGLMELLADRPDLVLHACERSGPVPGERKVAATLGARLVWIEECLTDTISPAAFESINLRFLCALVEEIRAHGLRSVYYYCGNPNDRLRLLLAAGADALALEESKKGFRIDIAAVASAVQGRCVLLGNLDAMHLLAHADEKELRQEIDRQVTAGRMNRGRFIMSLGSPVTPHTPVERVQRYCELAHELGR